MGRDTLLIAAHLICLQELVIRGEKGAGECNRLEKTVNDIIRVMDEWSRSGSVIARLT